MSVVYRDCMNPRLPVRELRIPLAVGEAVIPVGMSEEDFELLLGTLQLWKRRIVAKFVGGTSETVVGSHEIKEDSVEFEKDREFVIEEGEAIPASVSTLSGGDGKVWPHTMDAVVWAKEFVETTTRTPSIATDEGTMIGWFSNAIMVGYDEARRRCHQPPN